jgi:putative membrane protein
MRDPTKEQAAEPHTPPRQVAPPRADTPAPHAAKTRISSAVAKLFAQLGSMGSFAPPTVDEKSPPRSPNELALARTQMAAQRSLMAADRTLMAWVRTALSMVSFGFTIYKILEGIAESGTSLGVASQPRVVALFLVGLGNLSIVLGTLEYWQTARGLSREQVIPIWRPSFAMAVLIGVLSVFLFVAVIFRAL